MRQSPLSVALFYQKTLAVVKICFDQRYKYVGALVGSYFNHTCIENKVKFFSCLEELKIRQFKNSSKKIISPSTCYELQTDPSFNFQYTLFLENCEVQNTLRSWTSKLDQ